VAGFEVITEGMAGVRTRKRQMVDGLINLHLDRYKASSAELILGEARFVRPKTVQVRTKDGDTRRLVGDQIFQVLVAARANAFC
jgi:pyruvate/2-oxoglutarate dehydrogenase complex dihydrolipoamide dehydrogenase (E3) component